MSLINFKYSVFFIESFKYKKIHKFFFILEVARK